MIRIVFQGTFHETAHVFQWTFSLVPPLFQVTFSCKDKTFAEILKIFQYKYEENVRLQTSVQQFDGGVKLLDSLFNKGFRLMV